MDLMLDMKDVHKSFGQVDVLRGVSISISKGEVVAVVGASGAGKTTLLQIAGTLDKADKGNIETLGQKVNELNDNQLSHFRNQNIGFVFQFHHLLPEFTALENVCMPAYIGGTPKKEAQEKAQELLEQLGLNDRMHHQPKALSGGEQQRVAVARSLINQPALVFADEPSGNLDSAHAKELHQLFFQLREQVGQTFVIVTHNEELAEMADRKIVLRDGLVVT